MSFCCCCCCCLFLFFWGSGWCFLFFVVFFCFFWGGGVVVIFSSSTNAPSWDKTLTWQNYDTTDGRIFKYGTCDKIRLHIHILCTMKKVTLPFRDCMPRFLTPNNTNYRWIRCRIFFRKSIREWNLSSCGVLWSSSELLEPLIYNTIQNSSFIQWNVVPWCFQRLDC